MKFGWGPKAGCEADAPDGRCISMLVLAWQMADGKHGVLGAPMHMQCKETHKGNQNRISRVRVKLSKSPAESPETVDVTERPGRTSPPVLFVLRVYYSSGLSICHGSKSKPKSPNPANRFEKTDFERSAKHGLLCQIQSRHLNIF